MFHLEDFLAGADTVTKPKPKPSQTTPNSQNGWLAREAEASEGEEDANRVFKKVVGSKPPPRKR